MADITDPVAIRFINEEIRPLAELLRNAVALVDDMETAWFGQAINIIVTNAAGDAIADGRDAEGVSRLTGADIHNFVVSVIDYRNFMKGTTQPGQFDRRQTIDKPTVRPLTP